MNGVGPASNKRPRRSSTPEEGLVSPSAGLESPKVGGSGRGVAAGGGAGLPPPTLLVGGAAASSSSAPAARDSHRQHSQSQQQAKARPFKIRRKDEDIAAYGRELPGCSSVKDYLVEGDLGVGTFGVVTKATKRDAGGTKVAMKRIIMHNVTDGVPITTIREIKILKALSHENIVPVLDMVFEEANTQTRRGTILMVFPYMDHDLSGLLDNEQVSWTIPLIKLYAKQLLKGTAYLHKNNIIHRDLKAANILVNNTGVLKIADFGLARSVLGGLSRANNELGVPEYTNMVVTRWYRPPELFLRFKKYGTSIDIWGIGCILGEMLTKRPILQGNSDQEQLQKIWELCGLPTTENFPEWDQHGGCPDEGNENKEHLPGQLMVPPMHIQSHLNWKRHVREDFSKFGYPTYADLIDRCLTLDPAKRPTALECLEHDFFKTLPAPAPIGSLTTHSASHEASRKNNRTGPAPRLLFHGQPIPPIYAVWPRPTTFDPAQSQAAANGNGGAMPGSSSQPMPGGSYNSAVPPPTLHAQAPPPGFGGQQQQQQFNGPLQPHPSQMGGGFAQQGPPQLTYGMPLQQQPYLSNGGPQGYQATQPPQQMSYGPQPPFRPPPPNGPGLPYDSPGPSNYPGGFPTPQGSGPQHRPGGVRPSGSGRDRKPIHRAMPTSAAAGAPGFRLAPNRPSFLPGFGEDAVNSHNYRPPPPFRSQPPPPSGQGPPIPPPPPGMPPPQMSAARGMMNMGRAPPHSGGGGSNNSGGGWARH